MPRKKPASATQKSLKKLRSEGYLCDIVEKTIPHCFIKKDLFGFIDLLAIKDGEILGVQTTCGGGSGDSNLYARERKILAHDNYPLVKKAGIKIVVHGWKKKTGKYKNGNKKIYWVCKEIHL